jgi:hypothetical protein
MRIRKLPLVIACVAFPLSSGLAASVTVSDTSAGLPGVALDATAILIDAGLQLRNIGGGKFTVEAKGLHCDRRSNAPLDAADPHAGVATLKCRINARNEKDSKIGQPFAEGRAMTELLDKIDAGDSGVHFSDCAMGGYCGTYVRTITCTIDTTVQNFIASGRWSCVFTDGE